MSDEEQLAALDADIAKLWRNLAIAYARRTRELKEPPSVAAGDLLADANAAAEQARRVASLN